MVVIRKMKDRCKDAARMRREKERVEFVELSKLLPLPSSTTSQLDKASIIRLTSSYLRMRSAFPKGLGKNWGTGQQQPAGLVGGNQSCSNQSSNQIKELGSLLLQTLDGFVFALQRDGKIMYISETASVHLGLPQIDLTGSSVFEFIHPADHDDIMAALSLSDTERDELDGRFAEQNQHSQNFDELQTIELGRSFCMRMKCVLPKRNAGLVSNGFKAIHCSGYLKVRCKRSRTGEDTPPSNALDTKPGHERQSRDPRLVWDSYALVAVGHSLLPTASTEIKLSTRTFMFKANLDFRLHYIESPASDLLGYQHSKIVGQTMYQFVHVADLAHLELAHRQVLDKGQVVSRYHRLMRRDGGYIWVQTHATLINNPRSLPRPQHIVGICCVLSENQADMSRAILVDGANNKLDCSATGSVKKMTEKSSILIKKLNSPMKSLPSNPGQVNKKIAKRNRRQGHKGPWLVRNHNGSALCGEQQQVNRHQKGIVNGGRVSTNSKTLHTIGSTRRPSDDTCSVVSSAASTSGSSSISCCSYGTPGQTSGSTTSSPPQSEIKSSALDIAPCQTDYQARRDQYCLPQLNMMPAFHYYSDDFKHSTSNYSVHDHWPASGTAPNEQTAISLETSYEQQSSCWSSAPVSATVPVTDYSAISSHQEQSYYRFDEQVNYVHDGYMQSYPIESHNDNMTRSDEPKVSCDDQRFHSSYYTPTNYQQLICLEGNNSA